MPLYIGDYLRKTQRLTTTQHGMYLLLIMEYWTNGSLPTTDEELAVIVRLSISDWQKNKNAIARMFLPGWRHDRIEEERAKAHTKADAAKGSAQKRWADKRNANGHADAHASAYAIDGSDAMRTDMPDGC